MSRSFYNFITIASLLSLLHCAYSAAQHRAYLRLTEQPFVSLPGDILVQVFISLVALIYGASFVASPFQHIKRDPNRDKSWDDVASCLSFATFGSRAYAMSPAHAIRQQELVKQNDVDSYLSILTMPKKVHPELFAIHAFNVELAMIRDKINSSRGNTDATGMYRLQFWKDALSSIYGTSHLPVPRQPVAVALCSFASDAAPSHLESLVTARQQSLGDKPFSSVFELCGYGVRTAGSMIQLQVDCMARHASLDIEIYREDVQKAAADIGGAFGVMNLIRSTLPLFTRGVVLLPLDLLSLNGLTPDKVYKKKQPEDVKHVVQDMVRVAKAQLESGRKRAERLPRSIRPAFSSTACVTSSIISTTEKVKYDIYSPYLQRRYPLLLLALLFRKFTGRV